MEKSGLFISKELFVQSLMGSFAKLSPGKAFLNPVMASVWVGTVLLSLQIMYHFFLGRYVQFDVTILLWLILTLIFANFAEALAEGRGKARADSLKKTRSSSFAKKPNRKMIKSSQL